MPKVVWIWWKRRARSRPSGPGAPPSRPRTGRSSCARTHGGRSSRGDRSSRRADTPARWRRGRESDVLVARRMTARGLGHERSLVCAGDFAGPERGASGVLRVGHRGAAALAAENSLEAIEAAAAHRRRRRRARRAPRARRRARPRPRPRAAARRGDARRRARPGLAARPRRPARREGCRRRAGCGRRRSAGTACSTGAS